jgi:hypothetical protein
MTDVELTVEQPALQHGANGAGRRHRPACSSRGRRRRPPPTLETSRPPRRTGGRGCCSAVSVVDQGRLRHFAAAPRTHPALQLTKKLDSYFSWPDHRLLIFVASTAESGRAAAWTRTQHNVACVQQLADAPATKSSPGRF